MPNPGMYIGLYELIYHCPIHFIIGILVKSPRLLLTISLNTDGGYAEGFDWNPDVIV